MITIQTLSKSFGKHKVLYDINLTFKKGEISGVVGENGAGKSTLFKCMAGLESFDGSIEYTGNILKNVTGYLPTELFFFSKMTGYEYLQLLCNARDLREDNLKSSN